jgi:hypothetical protein
LSFHSLPIGSKSKVFIFWETTVTMTFINHHWKWNASKPICDGSQALQLVKAVPEAFEFRIVLQLGPGD